VATTAEQVVACVAAVSPVQRRVDEKFVAEFVDTTPALAGSALRMSVDLGLLRENGSDYEVADPLSHFTRTPDALTKSAVLRVFLERYEPFRVFRQQLAESGDLDRAARQTKALVEITASTAEVRETLINLGSYCGAFLPKGGGQYDTDRGPLDNVLKRIAESAALEASAERTVRDQIGTVAAGVADYNDVIKPLAKAMTRAAGGDGDGAVLEAGNAVESYLSGLAGRKNVDVTNDHGINAKLAKLRSTGNLPAKIVNMGGYLGHLRNAADHGIDADIGASWSIGRSTGLEYTFVACSFIAAAARNEFGQGFEL
jgi:hypothetical protein